MRRGRPRGVRNRSVKPCGTFAAYRRHVYHREPACAACCAANAARVAARRAATAGESR